VLFEWNRPAQQWELKTMEGQVILILSIDDPREIVFWREWAAKRRSEKERAANGRASA
jgi:hypothetical protein